MKRGGHRLVARSRLPGALVLLLPWVGCDSQELDDSVSPRRIRHAEPTAGSPTLFAGLVRGTAFLEVEADVDDLEIEVRIADEPPRLMEESSPPFEFALPGTGCRAIQVLATRGSGLGGVRRVTVTDQSVPMAPRSSPDLAGHSVVLIVADALHADHLGCYGGDPEVSPHLDRLAAEGVRFDQVYAPSAWTVPSIASLMTGLPQETHGLRDVGQQLPEDLPTLAQELSASGYHTAALLENPILPPQTGLAAGFDEYRILAGARTPDHPQFQQEVLDWWRNRPSTPFFLYVHYLPPHAPYLPPEPFRARFGDGPGKRVDGTVENLHEWNDKRPSADTPAIQRMRSLYHDHLGYLDHNVGELLTEIRKSALEQPLAVAFTADHGEAFGQHRQLGHNTLVHEEMVRVPWILWSPGSEPLGARVVATPFCLTDIAPTLLTLLLDHGNLGSEDARPWNPRIPTAKDRPVFLTSRYRNDTPLQSGVRWTRFKWVRSRNAETAWLFDLSRDPTEQAPVQDQHPVVEIALRHEFEAWQARTTRSMSETFSISDDMEAQLRELGYVAGD